MIGYVFLILAMIGNTAFAGLPPTTSKDSSDSSNVTTFNFQFPNFTGTHAGTTFSLGVNSIAGGGTGQATAAAAFNALNPMTTIGDIIYESFTNTAARLPAGTNTNVLTMISGIPIWAASVSAPTSGATTRFDTNSNLSANVFIPGYATTATSAATRTLTVASAYQQYFTGTTSGQILQLPVTSTLGVTGFGFLVTNNSTQTVTVNSSGSNLILAQAANTTVLYTCILTSGTTAASWFAQVIGAGGAVTPTVSTALVTGTGTGTGGFVSGTYTTPANVAYILVEMVGGGGGGGGTTGTGGNGGNTTFGTSLLTAGGGTGGAGAGASSGGAGGTVTLNSPAIGRAVKGTQGGVSSIFVGTTLAGGVGGTAPYFAGSGPGFTGANSIAGVTNTGGGGSGGGTATAGNVGSGGGSGGFISAIIVPTAGQTFSYSVGAVGSAGTGTVTGAAGGLGAIYVTEYYNNGAIGTATNVTGIVAVANGGTGTTGPVTFSVNSSNTAVSTTQPFIYSSVLNDSNSGYNATTGKYTIPAGQAGMWSFSFTAYVGGSLTCGIYQNGTIIQQGTVMSVSTSGVGSYNVPVAVGDVIDIRPQAGTGTATGTGTINQFSGFKIH
jgi:hypothetical protein